MKTAETKLLVVSAIAAVLGSVSLTAYAARALEATARGEAIPLMTSNQFLVNGEVTARTEADFTVVNAAGQVTTFLVTTDTSITKGGATIHLADLAVGDKVSVTAERAADGKLQAASVLVRVPYQ
jgi:hypothetical protein